LGDRTRRGELDKSGEKGDNKKMTALDKEFASFVTTDPEILSGSPVLKHTRVRLETVLECLEDGASPEEIAEWYLLEDLDLLRRIKATFCQKLALSH
jgi:uncharacterized protein (DUF433 family)